jgi:hypothetical protein
MLAQLPRPALPYHGTSGSDTRLLMCQVQCIMPSQVLHCSVPLAELPIAVNGAVVGLTVGPQQQPPTYRHTLNVSADSAPLPCLGLGIVRSLDIKAGLVYLLTPLSDAEMQRVDVLQVRCRLGVDV